ncbi:hypothetical protein A0257_22010 [Hymenobacter psoromatis]|nr:hypothetical protein A0257_22010 [Hymenobacter psoromatis]
MLYVKNMVCMRCIQRVQHELESLGLRVLAVRLGAAKVAGPAAELNWERVRETLAAAGFILLENPRHARATQVKQLVTDLLRRPELRPRDFIPVLAQEAGLSVRQLHGIFARLPGPESLVSHISEQRLAYAQELLAGSQLSISRIARQLGYGSLSHFSSQFRRFVGHAPSAYRQQMDQAAAAAASAANALNNAS